MLRSTLLWLAASLVVSTAGFAEDAPKGKVNPGSTGYLDALDGFRSIKFGTPFSEFKGLKLDQDHGKLKLYVKENEDLSLGLAQLTTIVYHFFDGKFYGVSLHSTDMSDTRTLAAIANTAFGAGDKLDDLNTIWQGETAWAQFSENPATSEGTLFIGDGELSRQLGEYEQKAANDAAAQL